MFNKDLFLTHIKNAPVPQELSEPLVEMKQKSDIDTIADIMGTSSVQRPLQEQAMSPTPHVGADDKYRDKDGNLVRYGDGGTLPTVSAKSERDRRFAAQQELIRSAYAAMQGHHFPTDNPKENLRRASMLMSPEEAQRIETARS